MDRTQYNARARPTVIDPIVFAIKGTAPTLTAIRQEWPALDGMFARMVVAGTACPTSEAKRAALLGADSLAAVEAPVGSIARALLYARYATSAKIVAASGAAKAFVKAPGAAQHGIARSPSWATGKFPLSFAAWSVTTGRTASYVTRLTMYNRAYLSGDRVFAEDLFPSD